MAALPYAADVRSEPSDPAPYYNEPAGLIGGASAPSYNIVEPRGHYFGSETNTAAVPIARILAQQALAEFGYVHEPDTNVAVLDRHQRSLGYAALRGTPDKIRAQINSDAYAEAASAFQRLEDERTYLTNLRVISSELHTERERQRLEAQSAVVEQLEYALWQIERSRQEAIAGTMIREGQTISARIGRIGQQIRNIPATAKVLVSELGQRADSVSNVLRARAIDFSSAVGASWKNARQETRRAVGGTVSATIAYATLGFIYGLVGIGKAVDKAVDYVQGIKRETVTSQDLGTPRSEDDSDEHSQQYIELRRARSAGFTRSDLEPLEEPTRGAGSQPEDDGAPVSGITVARPTPALADPKPSPQAPGIEVPLIKALAGVQPPEDAPEAQQAEALATAAAIRRSLAATEESGAVIAQLGPSNTIDAAIAAALIAGGCIKQQPGGETAEYVSDYSLTTLEAIAAALKAYQVVHVLNGTNSEQQAVSADHSAE